MEPEKKQFTTRLNAQIIEEIENFVNNFNLANEANLKTDKEIFEALLDVANTRFLPFKENSKEIEALRADLNKKEKELEELQNKFIQLQNLLAVKEVENEQSGKIINDVILKYSDLPKGLIFLLRDYAKDEKTLNRFKQFNSNGKFDGIIDEIFFTDNDYVKFKKLLVNSFILSAVNQSLPQLYTRQNIFNTLIQTK